MYKISELLHIFVDEQGLFRYTERIQNTPTTYAAKHPVLIPGNHHLAKLLVYCAHQNVKHSGTRKTLTNLRAPIWIVSGDQLAK